MNLTDDIIYLFCRLVKIRFFLSPSVYLKFDLFTELIQQNTPELNYTPEAQVCTLSKHHISEASQ